VAFVAASSPEPNPFLILFERRSKRRNASAVSRSAPPWSIPPENIFAVKTRAAWWQLPVPAAVALEPLVRFIECNLVAPVGTRTYTSFGYGSYLVWRLPSLSYSIDGRNIYPDSVAAAEAYQLANDGPMRLGPWQTADVAITPLSHATTRALEASPEWRRLRVSVPVDTTDRPAVLWAKRSWLEGKAKSALPAMPETVQAARVVPKPDACM